jgi:hypothetical protein
VNASGALRQETERRLARYRHERLERLTGEVVDALLHRYPGYNHQRVESQVTEADLELSCRTNIERVLEMIEHPPPEIGEPTRPRLFDAARATGHRRAEQGMPLDIVLRSFRVGGRILWEAMHEELADEIGPDEMRELGTRLWVAIDESSAQVAAAYHATERGLQRSHEQHRASLWEGLLTGRAEDPGFAQEASVVLGVPSDGAHRVVVLDTHATGVTAELEGKVGVARVHAAFVRRAMDVVGVFSAPEARLARLPELLRDGRHSIGLSAPVTSIRGVGAGYRQAALALASLNGQSGLAAFDDCLSDALLLSAPEIAERLVDVWLGPLLDLPHWESGTLLDTLEAWLSNDGSPQRAAERLYCHRNTVVNRLRRISAVLGWELTRPAPVELSLAMRAIRLRDRPCIDEGPVRGRAKAAVASTRG